VEHFQVDEFLTRYAPDDVRDTIAWLATHGYTLVSRQGEGTFGALLVYGGDAEVRITVDRSQWCLDVAPRPGREAWAYDLLLAAQTEDQECGALFPKTGSRLWGDPLPEQLPEGVSWRETLPDILEWVSGDSVETAVDRARHQRGDLMWLN
jgi:hypothetical protein